MWADGAHLGGANTTLCDHVSAPSTTRPDVSGARAKASVPLNGRSEGWPNSEDRGEEAVDLAGQLNTGDVLSTVDGVLGSQASRTSGILVQGVFWPSVPYYGSDPGRHPASMMLVRVYFDFHVPTPWYCSDANGDIDYYLVLYLDGAGHAQGYVDGWSYHYDGGGPFCTGSINDLLNKAVPGAIPQVQKILDSKLAVLDAFTFSTMYFLPGSGTSSAGDHAENADTDLAVAVLP